MSLVSKQKLFHELENAQIRLTMLMDEWMEKNLVKGEEKSMLTQELEHLLEIIKSSPIED